VTEEGIPTVKLEELFLLHVVPLKITQRWESIPWGFVTTSALRSQVSRQINHVDGSKKMILLHHETPVLSCGPVGDGSPRLRKIDTVETVAAAQFRSYRLK
jgi:hypothetical protein